MSVDSENKSNEAIVQFTPSADQENADNGNIEETPITPEMVLRLPIITDSKRSCFNAPLCNKELIGLNGFTIICSYRNIVLTFSIAVYYF